MGDVGNVTSASLSNLVPGTSYFFAITAYNSAGLESNPSNEVSYTVPLPKPSPPPTPSPTPATVSGSIPFALDGQADFPGYLQSQSGMTIYAAIRGQTLYVATWSPGSSGGPNDHFVFVTDQTLASASTSAPWSKAGKVAMVSNKPFIGSESSNSFCGWFNAPSTAQAIKAATNTGVMEGTIDLVATFGSIPQTIYIAAAAYTTGDGGILVSQCPAGNGDGNIDPSEFLPLSTAAITDENANGIFDRLEPALGFGIRQIVRSNGVTTVIWNSVPDATYQLESCNQLGGLWMPLGSQITAGTGQLTMSFQDVTNQPRCYYRIRLVSP